MALRGNIEFWKKEPDIENSYVETIVEPDGKEVEGTIIPEKWVKTGEETDVFVIIRMASIHMQDYDRLVMDENGNYNDVGLERGSTKGPYTIIYRYNIYESESKRHDRFYDPLYELDSEFHTTLTDLSLDGKNIMHYAYDDLKKKKGFENLTNV